MYACDKNLPVCAEDGKEMLTLNQHSPKPNHPPPLTHLKM